MSVADYRRVIVDQNFGKNDQIWFPKWIKRFAATAPKAKGWSAPNFCTSTYESRVG